jgi:acyl-CoA synthetase (AMP-forming)/AMP-acid ligase II
LAPFRFGKRPSSLRKVACAGLQDDLRAECEERFGVQMVEGYGLTEGGVVTMERLGEPHAPGSVGRAVPGRTVEIRRTDGSRCAPGEDGRIWIGGEGLMSGYFDNLGATADALPDKGWLRTLDIGHLDAEGRLYFTGRSGDIVRRSGENISLREVEEVIRSHPTVSEVAVITVPDGVYDVELAAYVVLKKKDSVHGDELVEHCSTRLSPHKLPRVFHFCRDLPRTGMERVSKARLEKDGPIDKYATFERPARQVKGKP